MSRDSFVYAIAGVIFLLVFVLDLPDVALHGWLFLAVALACFGLALREAAKREA